MNILLINHYAGSPELGMEFRPYYMAKTVEDLGHKVYILGANQSHLRKKQPSTGFNKFDDINYCWLNSKPYTGNGFARVKNIFSFLFNAFKKTNEILRWSKPDVVIASSTYPLDNYLAHYYARKCGAKVIYEVHDLWPLSPMEIGNLSKWHPFIMLLKTAENFGYKHCDQVISMLPNTLEHMTHHGLEPHKFHYIPNGIYQPLAAPIDKPLPEEHQKALSQLKAESKFIVGYAGGHAKSNALHKLLEAAIELPEITFVLMGEGSEKSVLQTQAKNQSNIVFLPSVEKALVPKFLSECDVLTLVCNDSPLYRFGVSPNKIFDYMLAKKPIAQLLNTQHEPVQEANAGYTVASLEEFIHTLKKLASMSQEERDRLGNNGYQYVIEHHSYSQLATKFIDVCKK